MQCICIDEYMHMKSEFYSLPEIKGILCIKGRFPSTKKKKKIATHERCASEWYFFQLDHSHDSLQRSMALRSQRVRCDRRNSEVGYSSSGSIYTLLKLTYYRVASALRVHIRRSIRQKLRVFQAEDSFRKIPSHRKRALESLRALLRVLRSECERVSRN